MQYCSKVAMDACRALFTAEGTRGRKPKLNRREKVRGRCGGLRDDPKSTSLSKQKVKGASLCLVVCLDSGSQRLTPEDWWRREEEASQSGAVWQSPGNAIFAAQEKDCQELANLQTPINSPPPTLVSEHIRAQSSSRTQAKTSEDFGCKKKSARSRKSMPPRLGSSPVEAKLILKKLYKLLPRVRIPSSPCAKRVATQNEASLCSTRRKSAEA